jgi:hypothetical protein
MLRIRLQINHPSLRSNQIARRNHARVKQITPNPQPLWLYLKPHNVRSRQKIDRQNQGNRHHQNRQQQ